MKNENEIVEVVENGVFEACGIKVAFVKVEGSEEFYYHARSVVSDIVGFAPSKLSSRPSEGWVIISKDVYMTQGALRKLLSSVKGERAERLSETLRAMSELEGIMGQGEFSMSQLDRLMSRRRILMHQYQKVRSELESVQSDIRDYLGKVQDELVDLDTTKEEEQLSLQL